MDYYVEDTIDTLKNIKNNPYGINDKYHAQKSIDLNTVKTKICSEKLVGIKKYLNETSIFQLLYEYNRKEDLRIIISILNKEEIEIITLIKKDANRRTIMHIKQFEAEYTYDCDLDVANIEVKNNYTHEKSIDLAFGVFLDFDENFLPVNLEIVSASKIVGIEKKYLINPNGHVEIIIGNDIIKVEVTFKLKDENECVQLTALNDYGFPTSQTNFAIV